MHARVTTLTVDPGRIDDVVRGLEEEDIPSWKEIDGFKGFTLLADRSSGKLVGTSYWESQQKMEASEDAVKGARQRAADTGGASEAPGVERFEVAVDTMA
jgi:heme-degrading monooxygenase HmoA